MLTIIVSATPFYATAQGISVDDLIVVDCLLPGQVRQLGLSTKYITPRRPIKTSAKTCAIRGGEYISYDRADYQSALKVWKADAETGDPKAQTYVAEIYERGLGTDPSYADAAKWYALAAEQGYSPAQLSLGRLYEQGLGVEKDLLTALNLYRQANGLQKAETSFVSAMQNAADSGSAEEIDALRKQVDKLEKSNKSLREKLNKLIEDADNSTDKLQKLQSEIIVKQQLLEEARNNSDLSQVSDGLNTQIAELKQQLEENSARYESEKALLKTEFSEKEKAFQKALDESDSEAVIAMLQQQLEDKQGQIDQNLDDVVYQLEQYRIREALLTEELNNIADSGASEEQVVKLKAELDLIRSQKQSDSSKYENKIAQLREQLASQQKQFELARKQDDSKVAIALLEEQIEIQEKQIEDSELKQDKLLVQLRNEIEARESQAKLLSSQKDSKSVIAKLKKQIKAQTKTITKETQRNKELTEQVNRQAEALASNESKRKIASDEGPSIVLKVPPLIASRGAK